MVAMQWFDLLLLWSLNTGFHAAVEGEFEPTPTTIDLLEGTPEIVDRLRWF